MLPYHIVLTPVTYSFTTALEPHPREALNTSWFRFKNHHREVNLLSAILDRLSEPLVPLYLSV